MGESLKRICGTQRHLEMPHGKLLRAVKLSGIRHNAIKLSRAGTIDTRNHAARGGVEKRFVECVRMSRLALPLFFFGRFEKI